MFNKKLSNILHSFNRTVEDLELLIRKNSDKVTNNTDAIKRLQEDNLDLIAESTHAQHVSDKIRDLISGEA